jgi:O-antigen/teichoic acid export membrane protein
MLVGQGLNLLLQAGYFVLLARLLGVREYGVFAGAFAFAAIATPYSSLGSGLLFVRYVSTNAGNFAAFWGNILLSTFAMGSLLTILLYVTAPHLLNPASASLILLVALGDCVCRQLVSCIGQVFQAFERLRMTAATNVLVSFLRLMAIAFLALISPHATAWQWAMASLIVSVLAAGITSAFVIVRYGRPCFDPQLLLSKLGEGFGFSLAGSTQSAYNDIDKTMLCHYGLNVANGIYTLAYRIIDVATIPITALDVAVLPRYFHLSREKSAGLVNLSIRLAKRAALTGMIASICMFLAAPLIPLIVGEGFRDSVTALRWLCLIPVFRGVHQLTGSAITGLGFQRYRTTAQFSVAALNVGLNLWLIPRYGWLGAAWASVASDGTLAVTNWSMLLNLGNKESRVLR